MDVIELIPTPRWHFQDKILERYIDVTYFH